jgi:CheY-like chemotaxis protein
VQSRAKGGLGIGLAVVKSLVEQQAGTVAVDSAGARQGSTFTVRLPLASAPAVAQPQPIEPGAALDGRRVLLVEDNADLREMMCALLQSRGCSVAGAADGHSAIALARQSKPEVALVDIDLPDMSGYEVARALAALYAAPGGIRLVALTGYGQAEDVRQALAAGFERHLKKPVRIEELEQALAERAPAGQA